MSNITAAPPHAPEGAVVGLCLDCNYALRDLPADRCPECGRGFDPTDRRTMNMGRPMGRLARLCLKPVGARTWTTLAASSAVLLWGWAWLPGGLIAIAVGFWAVVAVYAYRLARWTTREAVRRAYSQPLDLLGRHERRPWVPAAIMAVVGVSLALNLPLIVSCQLNRLIVGRDLYRMYAVEPMVAARDPGPRWVGIFYVDRVDVRPNGVDLQVRHAGTLRYSPDRVDSNAYVWLGGPWYYWGRSVWR